MTYAAAAPAPAATAEPRRPLTVRLAATLLVGMGVVGLAYAVATIAVTPGVVDRFRAAAGRADAADVDSYVTGVWMMATVGAVLAVVLFALYVVLALGLRRGGRGFRIGTWVVCGLGVLFGCGSVATVGAQRAGDGTPGTLGFELSAAYPEGWIELNIGMAVAQVLGYAVVAVLLMATSREFFDRPSAAPARSTAYVALPTYGAQQTFHQQPQAFHGQPQAAAPGLPGYPPSAPPSPQAAPAVTPEEHAAWSRPSAPTPAASAAPAATPPAAPAVTPSGAEQAGSSVDPTASNFGDGSDTPGSSASADGSASSTDGPDHRHSPHSPS